MLKRSFDVIVSGAALVCLSPVLLVVALAIRVGSRGPIVYRGQRVGRAGRLFRMWKFRTMVVNADVIGGPSTSDTDPRLTPIGLYLRKRKLDELPQLFNVLVGDMSLVGPRPEVQQYVAMYSAEERQILIVRPGITDFATLWNSDEGALLATSQDPERTYLEQIRPTKVRLQLEYVRRRSFGTDLWILYETVLTIAGRRRPIPNLPKTAH